MGTWLFHEESEGNVERFDSRVGSKVGRLEEVEILEFYEGWTEGSEVRV